MSVAIVVNSCEKFWKITKGPFLESAKKAKIPISNIYVVLGECDDEKEKEDEEEEEEGGHHVIYCKYVNLDYNAAIYFTQTPEGRQYLSQYTHFFYTHDTTVFLENFWDNICLSSKNCGRYIKLEEWYTKNIGLFNVTWFLEHKSGLMCYFTNLHKHLIMNYKKGDLCNEEVIYQKFNNLPECLNEDALFCFEGNGGKPLGKVFENFENFTIKRYIDDGPYLKDEPRLANLYKNPGIIKYQKNWDSSVKSKGWNLNL
jgi:hypothetical protein